MGIENMERRNDWRICMDHLEEGKSVIKNMNMKICFTLHDDDGIKYYTGYMTEEFLTHGEDVFEPLDWAMANAGCTEMRYCENGVWKVM